MQNAQSRRHGSGNMKIKWARAEPDHLLACSDVVVSGGAGLGLGPWALGLSTGLAWRSRLGKVDGRLCLLLLPW